MADSRERVYAVACAAMFVFGIILGLPGTVLGLPDVAAQFRLSLADRGVLISTLSAGLLIGSVGSGPLIDAAGQRASLSISAALVAVCLPLFALASSFVSAVGAMAAIGLASAGMNTASNALASDLFPEQRGRRMNGIALVVGLGGLTMPMATALGAGRVSWRTVVIAGGAVAAAVAVAGLISTRRARLDTGTRGVGLPRDERHVGIQADGKARVRLQADNRSGPPQPERRGHPAGAFLRIVRQPGFAWIGILLMLGAATEGSMAGWTSTFLSAAGFSAQAATWVLASHWLGLIVGRVVFSRRVDRAKRRAIVLSALCGAACLLVFVTVPSTIVLATGPFAIGLAIAVIVPTSLALAGDRYPGNAGALFGVLLTLAQVGGIVVPALIGVVAERAGVRAGLSILVLNCLLVAAVTARASRGGRR